MNHAIGIIAAFTTEINRGKSIDRHIVFIVQINKTHHVLVSDIRFELYLAANPFGTFFSDRLLSQFVAKLNLKLCAIDTALAIETRYVKLTLFFCNFLCCKGRRGKNESQLVNTLQFFL